MQTFEFGEPGLQAFELVRVGIDPAGVVAKAGSNVLNLNASGFCLTDERLEPFVVLRGIAQGALGMREHGAHGNV